MKRYYTFQSPPDPAKYNPRGGFHYMSLPGPLGDHTGGYVVVLMEESVEPHPDWTELPHLLEATPANFNGINTTTGAFAAPVPALGAVAQPAPTAIGGITHTDTTFQVAKKLAKINRHFHP